MLYDESMKRPALLLLSALAIAASACSLLLAEDQGQCSSNQDCDGLGLVGYSCDQRQICVEPDGDAGNGGASSAGHAGTAGNSFGGSDAAGSAGAGAPNPGGAAGGLPVAGSAGSGGNAGTGGNGGSAGGSPQPLCEDTPCMAAGGNCEMGVCVIACNVADCAPTCPAGMPCRVQCASMSCNQGIDCGEASSCEIECGDGSCINGITCAGSSCTVNCSGTNSCSIVGVVCRARTCDIDCGGGQSCKTVKCENHPDTCTLSCGGLQSCGTSVESDAEDTYITCDGEAFCDTAKMLCCQQGAHCDGVHAPSCL